jgi:hypothetical protein
LPNSARPKAVSSISALKPGNVGALNDDPVSRDSALVSSGLRRLNREAKTARVQDCGQAIQGRVARLRQHPIEAFPIQVGRARQGSDAAVGFCNVAKREKEHTRVFVLQASVEILNRLVWIPERFQQAFPIRFGLNR